MATETTGASVARPADVGLRREVGLIGAIWASETSIIGSGWLFASMAAYVIAGPAAIYGWLIGGFCVIVLALIHAELGGMYPVAGGTARFPHLAYGSVAGISFGFFSWLQAVTVAPIECFAVMQYAQYYFHGLYNPVKAVTTTSGFLWTIVLMAVFTAFNFMAVRLFSRVNSAITWWKVAIPVLTIIILFFKFKSANFTAGTPGPIVKGAHIDGTGGFMPFGIKAVFGAIPAVGIVFSYLGFEQADQLAGEIKNPQKNLPRAVIIAVLLGTTIYILCAIVILGATPTSLLTHGFPGIAATNPVLIYPFAAVAGLAGLAWLSDILHVDAFISPFGTGMIYQTSTSRVGYGLARNRYYPQIFQWTDRNGVPWFSLLMAFAFGLVFLLPFPSWKTLVGLVTSASVLMYAGAPLSLAAFRKQVPDAPRPYRMPAAVVLGPLGFLIANMLIYWSGFETVWKLGICLVIGYVLIGICMIFDSQRPSLDWKSAQWLPVYLIGMGLISWNGQYGPDNTNRIGFGYDMLIVLAFSLVIYYWAVASRLPREDVERLVAVQSDRMGDLPDTPMHH
jgi:amino acid transporter